jgi:hypothetical protein
MKGGTNLLEADPGSLKVADVCAVGIGCFGRGKVVHIGEGDALGERNMVEGSNIYDEEEG